MSNNHPPDLSQTMEKIEELMKETTIIGGKEEHTPNCPGTGCKAREALGVIPAAVFSKLNPIVETPDYIAHTLNVFMKLKMDYDEQVASMRHEYICVDVPQYCRSIAETSWETKPTQIARYLGGEDLLEKTVVAKVNGELWDLGRPLEKSCTLEFLGFNTPEGKMVFRHSSAHVLGQAVELKFDCLLGLSAVTEDGFFYEMGPDCSNGRKFSITENDMEVLQDISELVISRKQKFERLVVEKKDLLDMFRDNKCKLRQISTKIPDNCSATVYRCGPFIDLCVGPHIHDTGGIGAFQIEMESSPEPLWHADMGSVHCLYGVSFPNKWQLEEYNKIRLQTWLEKLEAVKCDYSTKTHASVKHTLHELVAKNS